MTTLCIIFPLEVKLVCSHTISPTQVTISPLIYRVQVHTCAVVGPGAWVMFQQILDSPITERFWPTPLLLCQAAGR